MNKFFLANAVLLLGIANGFAPAARGAASTKLAMAETDSNSRRSFFTKTAGSIAVAGLSLIQTPGPANAIGGGLKKVNAKLLR